MCDTAFVIVVYPNVLAFSYLVVSLNTFSLTPLGLSNSEHFPQLKVLREISTLINEQFAFLALFSFFRIIWHSK